MSGAEGAGLLEQFLQIAGATLNFLGAVLLAYEFWRRRDGQPPRSAELEDVVIRICRAVESDPVDRSALRELRGEAAIRGAEGRAESVMEGRETRLVRRAGRWGVVLITIGFLAQLLSIFV
jgi:hypothetical protein